MFQSREPQESLWQSEFLITPRKAKLMRRSWAEMFRNEALVLIEEERFAPMYSPDMGRPNRAVQTVLGVLVLKEMFDLTDMEALEELEFNLLWHHALRLEMEEAHLAQKTLHNFRVRLMEHDGGRLAFCETTDRMIEALGLRTGKQRLDSTHVMSNIAVLTRLGLFCETVRVFLLAVSREHPGLGEGIGDGLAQRYLKETGEASRYDYRNPSDFDGPTVIQIATHGPPNNGDAYDRSILGNRNGEQATLWGTVMPMDTINPSAGISKGDWNDGEPVTHWPATQYCCSLSRQLASPGLAQPSPRTPSWP